MDEADSGSGPVSALAPKLSPTIRKMLENAPSLPTELAVFWDAWVFCDAGRQSGLGGVSGIPPSEVHFYCELHQIEDPQLRTDIAMFVRLIDQEYLRWQSAKRKKAGTQ